jgi:hypothetical protein
MKVFKVKATPFPGHIYVIIGTIVQIEGELKRRKINDYNQIFTPGTDAACVSVETKNGTAIAVLLTPDVNDETIWHECLHAGWYTLDVYGVKLTVGNHEALAYTQGYLYKEIKRRMVK